MTESSLPLDEFESFDMPLEIIMPEMPGNPIIMSMLMPDPSVSQVVDAEDMNVNKTDLEDKPINNKILQRAPKSENAITGRGPKALPALTPVVIDDAAVDQEVDINDPTTLSISWRTIVEQFVLRYDSVFLKVSAKAHLDSCDLGTTYCFFSSL